ncbi:uncharacterized protein LOC125503237 [Dendroctonus ponderosae]|uniref:uncharacterized protein LOC125503237 n=1 Tax=Dendroctonus ponderosae TaxID=77166 RepID=UPI0020358F06|nr:uncharacterized protein LOC125503237 [Dendroctonus ponderosae]
MWAFGALVVYGTVLAAALSTEEPAVAILEGAEGEEATTNEATPKDLYVIRKVVYEIGILTDADNSTDFDNKTHEQIDVSFFDPIDNGTFIDLSNIPVPVETNVSGVALTGILPSNLGNLVFSPNGSGVSLNGSSFPLFPDKQVRVTKNISTVDKHQSANILSGISDVLGLSKLVSSRNNQEGESKLSK